MNVKSIEVVLENCEVLNIYTKDILYFNIFGAHEQFQRLGLRLSSSTYITGLILALRDNAECSTNYTTYDTLYERLKECDITWIEVHYDNGTSQSYGLKWPEGNPYRHPDMTCIQTPNKNLIISCNEPESIEADYIDRMAKYM